MDTERNMATSIRLSRRHIAALTLSMLAGASGAQPALPPGPITMIVGWPAGGPSDNVARLIATHMAEALGQSIVIDNKGGAGGNIGTDAAARARADGSTIMLATVASHGLNSALYGKLNHDPIKDFAPIGMITTSPSVMLVPTESPYRSVRDVIDAARAQPGKLNYGSGGMGSSQHLAGANFKKLAGVDVAHIPYKGTAPAMTDLMAGRVDFVLTTGAMSFGQAAPAGRRGTRTPARAARRADFRRSRRQGLLYRLVVRPGRPGRYTAPCLGEAQHGAGHGTEQAGRAPAVHRPGFTARHAHEGGRVLDLRAKADAAGR
jgi:hypothetical protein